MALLPAVSRPCSEPLCVKVVQVSGRPGLRLGKLWSHNCPGLLPFPPAVLNTEHRFGKKPRQDSFLYLPSPLLNTGPQSLQDSDLFWLTFSRTLCLMGCPSGSDDKESACSAGDPDSIPGSGRSPEEGHGNPLQYSGQDNAMDRGAWEVTVHGTTKSCTWLCLTLFHCVLWKCVCTRLEEIRSCRQGNILYLYLKVWSEAHCGSFNQERQRGMVQPEPSGGGGQKGLSERLLCP